KGSIRTLGILGDTSLFDRIMETMLPESSRKVFEELGDVDFAFDEEEIGRFRANLHLQRGNRSLTLRHVKNEVPPIEALNLPHVVLDLASSKDGLVVVTGSTGSGKSTTLACMINHINDSYRRHIITIEDPIEFTFTDHKCLIEQREVGLDTVSFSSALKHALRQDPDIIVLGELRSKDSVETAIAAADTGHLVLTTLHSNSAAQTLHRILDYFPQSEHSALLEILSNILRGVICQKLIPLTFDEGVVPITEVLVGTPVVKRLISQGEIDKLDSAIMGSSDDGMVSFNTSIFNRINEGFISEEVGFSYSSNPDELKMNLKGIFLNETGGIIG
ncbi:MAG: PilT/PilU family type 4a pilus ATPase, partial [Gammaproteobacteria bacterium]|nr:PilT/PilU family type 4a pilus ATPase [Gammaproteobacteria bacterium]